MEYKFIFDLDSTITKEEIIPLIAKEINLFSKIEQLTEKAMNGQENFEQNFINRINLIKDIPLDKIYKILENINFNKYIQKFISENKERCIIVTGNLDLIIKPILKKLHMQSSFFSCIGIEKDNKIYKIDKVINKKSIVEKFDFNFVAIGDGDNDIEMLKSANIGIAFGGSRKISQNIIKNADYVFYDDKKLYDFLNTLL